MALERPFISMSMSLLSPLYNSDRSIIWGATAYSLPFFIYVDALYGKKKKRDRFNAEDYEEKIDRQDDEFWHDHNSEYYYHHNNDINKGDEEYYYNYNILC